MNELINVSFFVDDTQLYLPVLLGSAAKFDIYSTAHKVHTILALNVSECLTASHTEFILELPVKYCLY